MNRPDAAYADMRLYACDVRGTIKCAKAARVFLFRHSR